MPRLEGQDLVPAREDVHDGRLPGAGAGTGVHDHRVCGLEDRAAALQHFFPEAGEFGTAVVDDGSVHGAQDAIRHIGGAWNLKEMTAGAVLHDVLLFAVLDCMQSYNM